jgi:hypothetical protein
VEPGAREVHAGGAGIHGIPDDADVTMLPFEREPGRVEWVAFNPMTRPLELGGLGASDALAHRRTP